MVFSLQQYQIISLELKQQPKELCTLQEHSLKSATNPSDWCTSLTFLVNACYRGELSQLGWTSEAHLVTGERTNPTHLQQLMAVPGHDLFFYTHPTYPSIPLASFAWEDRQQDAYIGMLSVFPMLQGQGWGKEILETAKNKAKAQGKKRLLMTVLSERAELIAFYQRRGYVKTGAVLAFDEDLCVGVAKNPLQLEELALIL